MGNEELANALDRSENYETYIASMNNACLITIITKLDNLDEVTTALTELSIREKEAAVPYALKYLKKT
ncbi:hypothetical protein AMS62_05925 [Bacillus sp. FJAT-18019]|nr:hypothetical protein AMS62_05925 [Bacillus sp. FJAT-18019]